MVEIAEKCRENHREIFLRHVTNPEMISALENVLSYWKYELRPALIQYSYEAVGGKGQSIKNFAELFSIAGAGIGIHDDIIDRTFRKPDRVTLPANYGLPVALTIGDLLLVKGLTSIRSLLIDNFHREVIIRILEEYERFFTEMCVGEVMEIRARKNIDMSLKEYYDMLWKLGVDLEICMKTGAILGKGTEEEIRILAQYGRNFGYLCRLHDELYDIINIRKLLSRIEYESIPLLILYASKKSNENYKTLKKILDMKVGYDEVFELLSICINSGALNKVKEIADNHTAKSINLLDAIGNNTPLKKLKVIFRSLNDEIKKMGSVF
jgi:geranylgeranyl diphosphate synthase type I